MPITYGNVTWPPAECAAPAKLYGEWGAWYAGDPERLAATYGPGAPWTPSVEQPGRGGIAGSLRRLWWGRTPTRGQITTRLHLPAASDVSSLSADLLFGEPPAFSVPEGASTVAVDGVSVVYNPTQDRLETILDQGEAYSRLIEAAEICSAYGGVFLRTVVDASVSDVPMLDALMPDVAIPEWRYGRLGAVTFWRLVHRDGDRYWRHLERHEVVNGVGQICHALYLGDSRKLGSAVPLDDHPDTAPMAALVNEFGAIPTGATRLDVVYVPNVRPNRLLRGSPLGRSDYAGAEGAMDGLDETWSSLMRDLRLGKGRIVVPRAYLSSEGRGQGAGFDLEQEVYAAVNTMGDPNRAMELTSVQFEIRVTEHLDVAAGHWRTIMRAAGLSADAFGEEINGAPATAKEVGKRGERTVATRSRKIAYWRPALRHLAYVLLELSVAHFPTDGVSALPVDVEWPDAAAPDPESQARTLQLLDAAGAVSTRTKVAMLHGDWDDPRIDDEVALIDGAPLEDPGTFTGADLVNQDQVNGHVGR